jgi:ribosome-binding protein aMBF1 (putative translation factor)
VTAAQVQRHRPPSTTDDLARRLRRCRVERGGISQADLADMLQIGAHRVQHIEHGDSVPTADEVARWTWVTGCDDQAAELISMSSQRRGEVIEYSS